MIHPKTIIDPARCSHIQLKAFANESLDPNHYLVCWVTWIHGDLRQKDIAKDSLGDVALQYLDAFGLRAPYKKHFQAKVCKDGLEGIQPLSATELLDDFICQVCKNSGFPLWGNQTAPNYVSKSLIQSKKLYRRLHKKNWKPLLLLIGCTKHLKLGTKILCACFLLNAFVDLVWLPMMWFLLKRESKAAYRNSHISVPQESTNLQPKRNFGQKIQSVFSKNDICKSKVHWNKYY